MKEIEKNSFLNNNIKQKSKPEVKKDVADFLSKIGKTKTDNKTSNKPDININCLPFPKKEDLLQQNSITFENVISTNSSFNNNNLY